MILVRSPSLSSEFLKFGVMVEYICWEVYSGNFSGISMYFCRCSNNFLGLGGRSSLFSTNT